MMLHPCGCWHGWCWLTCLPRHIFFNPNSHTGSLPPFYFMHTNLQHPSNSFSSSLPTLLCHPLFPLSFFSFTSLVFLSFKFYKALNSLSYSLPSLASFSSFTSITLHFPRPYLYYLYFYCNHLHRPLSPSLLQHLFFQKLGFVLS